MRISDWSSDVCSSDLLKPKNGDGAADSRFPRLHAFLDRTKTGFNTRFDGAVARYVGSVTKVVDRKWLFLAIYAVLLALLAFLFLRLPGGFLPNEDQGRVSIRSDERRVGKEGV